MEKGSPIFGLIDVFLINLNEIHADYASKIARRSREDFAKCLQWPEEPDRAVKKKAVEQFY